MNDTNAIYIDLSNMNVLFQRNGRFTMALNYERALPRLCSVLSSLSVGYKIFLCLKPRLVGEGDFEVKDLSMSKVPFIVDAKELLTVLKFFQSCHGVGDVYLCNWLHNYIERSRTDTFDSTFYYGSRVARLEVKDQLVEHFTIYDDAKHFMESINGEYEGYGDVGLLDTDGFKAQYPEFSCVQKTQLTAIIPLAQCALACLRITTDSLREELEEFLENREIMQTPEVVEQEEEVETEENQDITLEELFRSESSDSTPKRLSSVSFASILLLFASIVASAALGASYSFVTQASAQDKSSDYYNQADNRITQLQIVTDVYKGATTRTFEIVSLYDFIRTSGLPIELVSFESYPTQTVVRCNCASENDLNSFVTYLEQMYSVSSVNDLGVVVSNGITTHQYSVMFS